MSDLESEAELLPTTKTANARKRQRQMDWCCYSAIIMIALIPAPMLFFPLSYSELKFVSNVTQIECTLISTQIVSGCRPSETYPLLHVQCGAMWHHEKQLPNVTLAVYRGIESRATWSLTDTTLWLASLPPANSSITLFYNPMVDPFLTTSCDHTTGFKIGIATAILSIATIVGTLCVVTVEYIIILLRRRAVKN